MKKQSLLIVLASTIYFTFVTYFGYKVYYLTRAQKTDNQNTETITQQEDVLSTSPTTQPNNNIQNTNISSKITQNNAKPSERYVFKGSDEKLYAYEASGELYKISEDLIYTYRYEQGHNTVTFVAAKKINDPYVGTLDPYAVKTYSFVTGEARTLLEFKSQRIQNDHYNKLFDTDYMNDESVAVVSTLTDIYLFKDGVQKTSIPVAKDENSLAVSWLRISPNGKNLLYRNGFYEGSRENIIHDIDTASPRIEQTEYYAYTDGKLILDWVDDENYVLLDNLTQTVDPKFGYFYYLENADTKVRTAIDVIPHNAYQVKIAGDYYFYATFDSTQENGNVSEIYRVHKTKGNPEKIFTASKNSKYVTASTSTPSLLDFIPSSNGDSIFVHEYYSILNTNNAFTVAYQVFPGKPYEELFQMTD